MIMIIILMMMILTMTINRDRDRDRDRDRSQGSGTLGSSARHRDQQQVGQETSCYMNCIKYPFAHYF